MLEIIKFNFDDNKYIKINSINEIEIDTISLPHISYPLYDNVKNSIFSPIDATSTWNIETISLNKNTFSVKIIDKLIDKKIIFNEIFYKIKYNINQNIIDNLLKDNSYLLKYNFFDKIIKFFNKKYIKKYKIKNEKSLEKLFYLFKVFSKDVKIIINPKMVNKLLPNLGYENYITNKNYYYYKGYKIYVENFINPDDIFIVEDNNFEIYFIDQLKIEILDDYQYKNLIATYYYKIINNPKSYKITIK
jgi:hypothetical protein